MFETIFKGINAIMVHILKPKPTSGDFTNGYHEGVKKYLMRIASMGDMRAVLGKSEGPIRLLPAKMRKQIRTNPTANLTVKYTHQSKCDGYKMKSFQVPDPEVTEIYLDEHDEYMILANRNLWDVMTPENAIKEVTLQRNVILAAKRLQDLAQSYGKYTFFSGGLIQTN